MDYEETRRNIIIMSIIYELTNTDLNYWRSLLVLRNKLPAFEVRVFSTSYNDIYQAKW